MAKIAIDARELKSTTGRYLERLLHYLQQIDTKNDYLVLLMPEDINDWEPEKDNFTKVECPYQKFTFAEQIGYRKFLKKLGVDLVHFGMTQQPILYFGKCVTSIHDLTGARFKDPLANQLTFWFKQQIYKFVIWWVAKKSKYIITISEYSKKDIAEHAHAKAEKIVVTHLAADEILETAEPVGKLRGKSFIFYIGRPQPHKNLSRLIQAYAQIKEAHPDLMLVLAGRKDAIYDSYFKEAQKLGVANSVVFTGYVTDGQLKWLYHHCKAYIFPSLSEGFGLPGLEAMVHRAPVVSSINTSLPEVYDDAAWYFNPLDVNDMVNSISEVLDNRELRAKLIRAGRKRAKTFSWQKTAEQTLEVYKKVLNQ